MRAWALLLVIAGGWCPSLAGAGVLESLSARFDCRFAGVLLIQLYEYALL